MSFPINPPRVPIGSLNRDGSVSLSTEWYSYFAQLQKLLGGPSDPFTDVTLSSGGGAVAVAQLAISQQIGPLGSFPAPQARTVKPVGEGGTGIISLVSGTVPMGNGTDPYRASNITQDGSGNITVGLNALRVGFAASTVNYFDLFGAATTFAPSLRTRGSDTNIPMGLDTKGTGAFNFTSNSFGGFVFRVFGTAGNDHVTVTAGTGVVTIAGAGSSGNISINLAPKGTGLINATGNGFGVAGTQVVAGRNTGWTAMTGTADEATAYDTTTITLPQLAERVNAIQVALTTHGLIGA